MTKPGRRYHVKYYILFLALLIWACALSVQLYRATILAWKEVTSRHRMFEACQKDPRHRESFYSACIHIEQTGKQPTFFWLDVLMESSPHVYPLIWFQSSDLFSFRGAVTMICMFVCRKLVQELLEVLWQRRAAHPY